MVTQFEVCRLHDVIANCSCSPGATWFVSVVPEFLNLLGCSGFSSVLRHIGAAWFTCQRLVANLAGLCPIVR